MYIKYENQSMMKIGMSLGVNFKIDHHDIVDKIKSYATDQFLLVILMI